MRFALAQVNPTVGDLAGNASLITAYIEAARRAGSRIVVFPELVVSGYPPEDLLLKDHFLLQCREALGQVARACRDIVALVGVPLWEEGAVYNAVGILGNGVEIDFYRKICLPNYAVFDEKRYFQTGDRLAILEVGKARLAVNVCEDIWIDKGPTEAAALLGAANAVINLSMSPYHLGKGKEREAMLSRRASVADAFVLYVNGVGGQDELVFDGQSVVFDPQGRLIARASQFVESLLIVDLEIERASSTLPSADIREEWSLDVIKVHLGPAAPPVKEVASPLVDDAGSSPAVPVPATIVPSLSTEAEIYEALCLGVRDYVQKNGFRHVVIGMSGGIDSALTACIATDALGNERVTGVSMPSRYSSEGTQSDARETARRLDIDFREIPIEKVFHLYLETLEPYFAGTQPGVAEQNIQARIRGNLLMALSNKFGWLVLTTGNKSETAVGYATLYGDMAGGFAVLKDVPKTMVYRLSHYRNGLQTNGGPIPDTTITRAPSAELAANQTDQDSLPPYEILDRIIEAYVVSDESVEEIVARGIERREVERVVAMIDGNEYKRRQAPPGVRITPKAFGKDRRLPMTNRYRG
ncbi:MAG: NAD+ synthase [Actinobacteria bacterium]|nr:NAD+ synthase [Actinomycetota bacterium]